MVDTLTLILQEIPTLPKSVARDIATCLEKKSKASVRECLERYARAIRLNEDRLARYTTDKEAR
jgi:hypothetical protein